MKIDIFILFTSLSLALAACSSSDEINGDDTLPTGALPSAEFKPNDLPAEPYAEDAVKVIANDADAPFYSLELMADGYYLLATSRRYNTYDAPVRVEAKANGKISIHKKHNSSAVRTRSTINDDGTMVFDDGSEYGKFEKLGNKRYRLSNGIVVDLMNATGSDRTILYTNLNGYTSRVYVSTSTPDVGKDAQSICRTWDYNSFEIWEYMNGAYVAHGKATIKEGKVESEFESTIGFEVEDVLGEDSDMCYKIIFTTSNTYICFYMDGQVDVAQWNWVDRAQGILHYEDIPGNEDYDYEWDGYVTVRFAGNQMRIYEDYIENYADTGFGSDMKVRTVIVNTLTAAY